MTAQSAFLIRIFTGRIYWLAMLVLGLFMEAFALYYQYVLGDEPCEICIHIRIWVAAFSLLALIMCFMSGRRHLNVGGHFVNTLLMCGLWERCKYLLDVENGKGEGSCNFFLDFPAWFALDKWFPAMFEVRNLCSYTPEVIFGLSMAQTLTAVSTALVATSLVALYFNIAGRSRVAG